MTREEVREINEEQLEEVVKYYDFLLTHYYNDHQVILEKVGEKVHYFYGVIKNKSELKRILK